MKRLAGKSLKLLLNKYFSFITSKFVCIGLLLFRLAALELNRKSQMVSEAVEEVLNLVQNATQTFKSMMSCDSSDGGQGNKKP